MECLVPIASVPESRQENKYMDVHMSAATMRISLKIMILDLETASR
jgi:hypothetical protein